jgi:uncharacterized delta-60 repeat protein
VIVAALALAIPASASADSMTVQPDGKIVVGGASPQASPDCGTVDGGWRCGHFVFERPSLVRFQPDGSLDTTFGSGGGVVDFRWGLNTGFQTLAVKPDAGIVSALTGSSGFRLTGFAADGSLDQDFGVQSVVTGPEFGLSDEVPTDIVPRAGKLAVGSNSVSLSKAGADSRAALVLFGEDGKSAQVQGAFPGNKSLTDLAEQPSGTLVASANFANGLHAPEALLGRFSFGTAVPYDASFADGKGFAALQFGYSANTRANAVAALGNKILLAGSAVGRFLIARFDENGIIDPSFDNDGIALPSIDLSHDAEATDIAVQADGKILVAGWSRDECDNPSTFNACRNVVVGRLEPDGSVDTGFGSGGFVHLTTPNSGFATPEQIELAVLPDGRILVSDVPAVVARGWSPDGQSFVLFRLTAAGALDPSFGQGGIATALPCQGSIEERRRSGCIASGRARLGLHGLASGRLRLRVDENQLLDPIQAVRLLLPRGLRVRASAADRLNAVAVGGNDAELKLFPHGIVMNRMGGPHAVVLTLRRGLLKAARGGRTLPHKLIFRVKVRFRDGTTQTLRVKPAG